jgi:hypothetical protein
MRVLIASFLIAAAAPGALNKLYVDERTDYKDGASFAKAGPYERITANAFYGPNDATAHFEMLKPREPRNGNGTLLYIIGLGPNEQALLEAGFTILRMRKHSPEALRDVVSYLRFGRPGILLLSDQRNYIKRAVAFASGGDVKQLAAMAPMTVDEQGRKAFDVLWAHDSQIKVEAVPNGAQVHITKGSPLEALAIQLHSQLSAGK